LRDTVPQPRRWRYDDNGNITEYRDRDGSVHVYTYRSWNALHQHIDPLRHTTTYGQSGEGKVNRVEDPGGTVTDYVYDLKDRLVEIHCDGEPVEGYRYDAAANVIEKCDSRGETLVTWEVGPATLDRSRTLRSGERHAFEYDDRGRLVVASSPEGQVTCAFDDAGRCLEDKRDGRGVAHEFADDQLSATVYFERFRVKYVRVDDAWIITDPTGASHRVVVAEDGVVTKELASGIREQGLYDTEGRCLGKLWTSNGEAQARTRACEYSPEGDLVAVRDSARGVCRYGYDAAHRLVEEVLPDGTRLRFTVDSAGNVTGKPGLLDVAMGSQNRLMAANGHRFAYDDRARIASRDGRGTSVRYQYDALDRLVGCDIGGEPWTARYDALCRRITKTWRGETTKYYWDDFRLAAECRHDGQVRLYLYEDHCALVPFMFVEYDSMDAAPASGRRFYLYTNQVGAPVRVDDDSRRQRWSAWLEPYGLAQVDHGSDIELSLRFPGHWYDPETGLQYNRFRYYSPELARYLQADPAGLEGGINEYAYPASPLVDVDLDGLAKRGGTATSRRSGRKAKGKAKGADADCPLQERVGWVAPYGEQKKVTGDGSVDRDHQPSKLAIKKAIADDIDKRVANGEMKKPSKKQMREINKRIDANATAVVVDHDVHKAGDTHGSQNKEQSEIDKKDLGKAAKKDADKMVAATKKLDPENTDAAKAAAKEIKKQTHESVMDENRQIVDDVMAGR
jgi:RHS repeat-associated protein